MAYAMQAMQVCMPYAITLTCRITLHHLSKSCCVIPVLRHTCRPVGVCECEAEGGNTHMWGRGSQDTFVLAVEGG